MHLAANQAGQARRRVLLLQGPVGSFFAKLQDQFTRAGMDCWRVTFNAADRHFAGTGKTVHYKGEPDLFDAWLANFMARHPFDVVVFFGSEKPVHSIARAICRSSGTPCISLEEGYFRPGFISIEEDGNNWRSPIAGKIPASGLKFSVPERKTKGRSSLYKMSALAAQYYIIHALLSNTQEKMLFHKRDRANLFLEARLWIRNAWRRWRSSTTNNELIAKLLEHHVEQYYLVPLQVRDDAQLTPQSARGWTNESLCEAAIRSFARYAPPYRHLVFKIHPLDRGHCNDRDFIMALASKHGISRRVHVVDHGSVGLLTRHCAGMITINSSSGLSAIHNNKPLAVLGRAIYANPKLAHNIDKAEDIDVFWRAKRTCTREFSQRYLNWVRSQSVAPGDFYLPDEMPDAIANIVARCSHLILQHSNPHAAPQHTTIEGGASQPKRRSA